MRPRVVKPHEAGTAFFPHSRSLGGDVGYFDVHIGTQEIINGATIFDCRALGNSTAVKRMRFSCSSSANLPAFADVLGLEPAGWAI